MKERFEKVTRYVAEWSPNVNLRDSEDFRAEFWFECRVSMDAAAVRIPRGSCIKLELRAPEGERLFLVYPSFLRVL